MLVLGSFCLKTNVFVLEQTNRALAGVPGCSPMSGTQNHLGSYRLKIVFLQQHLNRLNGFLALFQERLGSVSHEMV